MPELGHRTDDRVGGDVPARPNGRVPGRVGTAGQEVFGDLSAVVAVHQSRQTFTPAAVVGLQRMAGNQAVTSLIETHRQTPAAPDATPVIQRDPAGAVGPAAPVQASPPATELDPLARVDQLQLAMTLNLVARKWTFDLDRMTAALTGLTKEQGKAIRNEYKRRTNFDLGEIISNQFQLGDLVIKNNIKQIDQTRLLNLLGGTVAPQQPDPAQTEAAGELVGSLVGGVASLLGNEDPELVHAVVSEGVIGKITEQQAAAAREAAFGRFTAEAAGLKKALDKDDTETVLLMIRRPMNEQQELAKHWDRMFHESLYNALQSKLKGRDAQRAAALWGGDMVTADRLALEDALAYQQMVEGFIERHDPKGQLVAAAASFGGGLALDVTNKIKQARASARARIEERLAAIAQSGDSGPAANPAEGKAHLAKVLDQAGGAAGPLRPRIDAVSDAVSRAIIEQKEPEELAARLARADLEGKLKPTELEGALRRLRSLARSAAVREIEKHPGLASQADKVLGALTNTYYQRFQSEFERVDTKRPLYKAIGDAGNDPAAERNQALIETNGSLPAWRELDLALRQKPKDMDRVRQVLNSKSKDEIETIAHSYQVHTDRDLRADVLGTEEERLIASIKDEDKFKQTDLENRVMLQGGVFESEAADPATRLAEEGHWVYGRFHALERAVMENRGTFAKVRDWSGNIEKQLVERARQDSDDAAGALFRVLADNPPDLHVAKAKLAELKRASARLERNVGIYSQATEEAFNEFVDFAVLAVTTIATLGEGGVLIMALRATASTIGTKMILKGNDYSPGEFLMDLRSGVGAAVGGKLAEGMLKPLATKLAAYAEQGGLARGLASKVGSAALWEAENLTTTAVTNQFTGQDTMAGMGVAAHEQNLVQHGISSAVRAGRGKGGKTRKETVEPQTRMELEGPGGKGRPAEESPEAKRRREDEARRATADDETRATQEDPWAPRRPEDEPAVVADAREEMRNPTDESSGGGGDRVGGGGGGDGRKPPGPMDPAGAGIGKEAAGQLQAVANELDIVIKARPVNPQSGALIGPEVLAKMEIIKAKTITPLDELIGGPPNRRGVVGLFVPRRPDPALPPDVHAAAQNRYTQRLKEYLELRGEYQRLSEEGLVRIQGGVVMVADPTKAGGKGEPRGKFKAVAGDIDIFDITHADGSALTREQRTFIQQRLQSMGIGVEHGAHAWWEQQSPETFDPGSDARIRQQHQSQEQLLAFVPKGKPQGVWADSTVIGPKRDPNKEHFMPLKGMQVVGDPMTGTGRAPHPEGDHDPGYVDIGDDLGPGGPSGPGRPGGGGGGGGPGRPPQPGEGPEPPGRPEGFPSYAEVGAHLERIRRPATRYAQADAVVLLPRIGNAMLDFQFSSGTRGADTGGAARTDLTQPTRRVTRPNIEYGPDRTGALTVPIRGDLATKDQGLEALRAEVMERLRQADAEMGGTPEQIQAREADRAAWADAYIRRTERVEQVGEVEPPHSGPRAHDAEANLMERLSTILEPGDVGELHLWTNFPHCPSCIEMIYRFQSRHRGITIISHAAT